MEYRKPRIKGADPDRLLTAPFPIAPTPCACGVTSMRYVVRLVSIRQNRWVNLHLSAVGWSMSRPAPRSSGFTRSANGLRMRYNVGFDRHTGLRSGQPASRTLTASAGNAGWMWLAFLLHRVKAPDGGQMLAWEHTLPRKME